MENFKKQKISKIGQKEELLKCLRIPLKWQLSAHYHQVKKL